MDNVSSHGSSSTSNIDINNTNVKLQNKMTQLDSQNPAYTAESININGTERTVYNSNGDRIAQSEAALRAFYAWFGDSKIRCSSGTAALNSVLGCA